jgi:Bifunctional DNA primase/polymerase, N-terminal
MAMNEPPPLQRILALTGPALLLPWPRGSKGAPRRWGHMQLALMDDRVHLSLLEKAGNIGVALGKVSDGLVSIDIDQDERVPEFLELNPLLSETLRTKGARGCNVWVRMKGNYPPTHKLKDKEGQEIGEFRSDGAQTIIFGTHPSGAPYSFEVEKPARQIAFSDIVFFVRTGDFTQKGGNNFTETGFTETKRLRRHRDIETKSRVCGLVVVENKLSTAFREIISGIAPKDVHQNNGSLFNLARLCRSAEKSLGRPTTTKELEMMFDCWCDRARPFWRPELSREDYWMEFLRVSNYARFGLDEDPLQVAYARARARPLPDVPGVVDERIRLLASMLLELSSIAGGGEFYLPTRKLGPLLGISHVSANSWIGGLRALGFIKRTSPGNAHRSPRYVYINQLHTIPR